MDKEPIKKVLFREHRRFLSDAMLTVIEVSSLDDIKNKMFPSGAPDGTIKIDKYTYDNRIKWDTYIVTISGYGVLGFTNGPII